MGDYTRTPPGTLTTQQVWIQSVDVANQSAMGLSKFNTPIFIDCSYYVGAVQVMPTVGDQWVVQKMTGDWRLSQRLPFNDGTNQSTIVPTQGQHVIGTGQGPVELQGTLINANAPLATQALPSTGLPPAASVAAGTQLYDSTILRPVWSNGIYWHDAAGNAFIAVPTAGAGSLTVTTQQKFSAIPALPGYGVLSATIAQKVVSAPALLGRGRLTAMALATSSFVSTRGHGALVATVGRQLGATVTLSGKSALVTKIKPTLPTAFSGKGGLSATVSPSVMLDAVGAGADAHDLVSSPQTISWTHTATAGTDVFAFVSALSVTDNGIASIAATYGGTPMTVLANVKPGNVNYGLLTLLHLANAPGSAQTVIATATAVAAEVDAVVGDSVSYFHVGSIGTISTNYGTSPSGSVSITGVADGIMIGAFLFPSGPVAFLGWNGTARYEHNSSDGYDNALLIQDIAGVGSGSFTANGNGNDYYGAIAAVLKPV